jgi:lipopolysaccharide/colanic/teichoic acid biosynthesis glycosyltransferase
MSIGLGGDNSFVAEPALELGLRPRGAGAYGRARRPSARDEPPSASDTASAGLPLAEELLPRQHFLAQLHREKRRVDRSKAPLSLIIYRMAQRSGLSSISALASQLLANKRETDIAGWLGDDVLAVICPDTGDEGGQRFIDKIDAMSGDLHYSVECLTYPDHLFDGLAAPVHAVHGPSPLLAGQFGRDLSREAYWLKRPLDILGALVALALFAPVMLATALAIKLSSRGPVIFTQTRLGRWGVPFRFYKFRSMTVDNDDRIHRDYVKGLIGREGAGGDRTDTNGAWYKIKADPRVTWVGRFIRRTSIDELPQLLNVLTGDMSLVGPRPPLSYEAESYRSWHLRRVLDIRPGMTGLWQVEGRGKLTFDEMVRMDLSYIRSCSLRLDLRILAKTAPVVLSCEGAS